MGNDRAKTELRRIAVEWEDHMKGHAADCLKANVDGDKIRAAGADSARVYCAGVVEGLRLAMVTTGDYDGLRLLQAEAECA